MVFSHVVFIFGGYIYREYLQIILLEVIAMSRIRLFQIALASLPVLIVACSHSGDGNNLLSPNGAGAMISKITCVRVDPTSIHPADFVDEVDNAFFSLTPGARYVYRAETEEGEEIVDDTVTSDTKKILGVTTIVVHDLVSRNNSLIEETFDWYAQDKQGNVWYFGEDSRQFENGVQTGTEGSWEAGVNGALAGIIMLACPKVGNTYYQEFLATVAEDVGRVAGLKKRATVPFGTFTNCLKTLDSSILDPGADEYKYYAPGVGLVLEVERKSGVRSELISATGLNSK